MKTSDDHTIMFFTLGVGLGLLAGLLWAPRAGKEMRDELRRGTTDGLEHLREGGDKLRSTLPRGRFD